MHTKTTSFDKEIDDKVSTFQKEAFLTKEISVHQYQIEMNKIE